MPVPREASTASRAASSRGAHESSICRVSALSSAPFARQWPRSSSIFSMRSAPPFVHKPDLILYALHDDVIPAYRSSDLHGRRFRPGARTGAPPGSGGCAGLFVQSAPVADPRCVAFDDHGTRRGIAALPPAAVPAHHLPHQSGHARRGAETALGRSPGLCPRPRRTDGSGRRGDPHRLPSRRGRRPGLRPGGRRRCERPRTLQPSR